MKITTLIRILILVLIVQSSLLIISFTKVAEQLTYNLKNEVIEVLHIRYILKQVDTNLMELEKLARNFILTDDIEELNRVKIAEKETLKLFNFDTYNNVEIRDLLQHITAVKPLINKYFTSTYNALSVIESKNIHDIAALNYYRNHVAATRDEVMGKFKDFRDKIAEMAEKNIESSDAYTISVIKILEASGFAVVIFVSIISFICSRKFIEIPLSKLQISIYNLSQGEGDLTQRLEVKGNSEVDKIADEVNNFIIFLQKLMLQINEAVEEISQAIGTMTELVHENKRSFDQHSSETDQVVTAVNQLSATATSIAHSAEKTSSYTQETNKLAIKGEDVMKDTSLSLTSLITRVNSVSSHVEVINGDVQEINQSLGIITDISEQTNLLALNAAIEAARAGEQGRGFAVVADEVRVLATRTNESADKINETLSKLRHGSDEVMKAMELAKSSTGETESSTQNVSSKLSQLSTSLQEINDYNASVATAAEQQNAVTEEVNRNMENIRDMVKKLQNSSNETSTSLESLLFSQEKLLKIINNFKLS